VDQVVSGALRRMPQPAPRPEALSAAVAAESHNTSSADSSNKGSNASADCQVAAAMAAAFAAIRGQPCGVAPAAVPSGTGSCAVKGQLSSTPWVDNNPHGSNMGAGMRSTPCSNKSSDSWGCSPVKAETGNTRAWRLALQAATPADRSTDMSDLCKREAISSPTPWDGPLSYEVQSVQQAVC
jgi:hypothetical protein